MTERENILKVYNKEVPEWVPEYTRSKAGCMCSFLMGNRGPNGGTDIFGVPFTPSPESADGASLPTPNAFILKDITKWRDVIKVPDISHIDWEALAKKDQANIDFENRAVSMSIHVGYFQHLMNFMGFTEGLCAMYEEPEEVVALMEYLSDFYVEIAKNMVRYYKADILDIVDDTATALNPFFSLEMYRELFKPYHARLAQVGVDAGMFIEMHNCGRCEDFIDDWMEFGVTVWNPAQIMNDLQGIKAKYGRDLVLCGCWDYSGPVGQAGATEEFVRSEVRKCLDTYAVDGGFIFWNYVLGHTNHPDLADKLRWIDEEVYSYGHQFYK